jgi:AcrR family transcriptional regulator
MPAKGYLNTSVADLIKAAGVSRQTFYELFESKQDCFLAGYARRQDAVIGAVLETESTKAPIDRFAALLRTYLGVMALDPALARLYLIGVYTAGPEAVAKRLEMQQQFVEGIAALFGVRSDEDHFVCQALVATISTLVTNAVLVDDTQAVIDLHAPLVGIARQLLAIE